VRRAGTLVKDAAVIDNPSEARVLMLYAAGFVVSLVLMVGGAEKLTEGLLRMSVAFGVAPFVLGYLLSGIDLDNLGVGIASTLQGMPLIALGTVIGSATFLLTVAVGLTAIIAPLRAPTPRRLIVLTLLSPLPLAGLALDGVVSRPDGAVLLVAATALIIYVVRTARTHPLLAASTREVDKALRSRPRWWAPALVGAATLAIVAGAELFRWSATGLLARLGWDAGWFGMVVVAAAVSFEEVPRMVSPARRGHPEVSIGSILGTVLFSLLFNIGIIALVRPVPVGPDVLRFYWPTLMLALLLVSGFLWRGVVGRREGMVLLALYGVYVVAALT
jgi:cation:H+ antiporter